MARLFSGTVSSASGFPLRADIPDGKRRDGRPQRVVRRKHPVIPVPMPPDRRDQRCQPVKKLKRRQFNDATGTGPRRLSRTYGADPVPALVPGQGVANPLKAVARARHNRVACSRRCLPVRASRSAIRVGCPVSGCASRT
jgi:hypothetical protein